MPPSRNLRMPHPGTPSFRHRQNYDDRQDDDFQMGCKLCCCRIFTCINLQVLASNVGLLKIAQVLLGSLCQMLLVKFGAPYAADIGQAYTGCLQTVATSLTVASVLMVCYVMSARTYRAMRESLFEVIFNALACCSYLSASTYMAYTVMLWLYPRFLLQPAYIAYPAMTGVYYIGALAGLVHGADALGAYRAYRRAG